MARLECIPISIGRFRTSMNIMSNCAATALLCHDVLAPKPWSRGANTRSEEHTSELQSRP